MSAGYSHAPVILVISIVTLIFSTALKVSKVELDLHRLMRGEIWRLITTHFVFRNPAQLMVGLIVLYSLRGFERQMGSKKFGAYLIYSLLSSTVLSVLFVLILNVLIGWLSFVPSSGPFFLIYSLMIFYYWHVPALYPIQYSVLGLRLSEKSWIYLLAAQLLFSDSWSSILASASGLIAGYVYLKDLFHVQSYRLPALVERVFGVFGNLFQAFHMPTAGTAGTPGQFEMRDMSSSSSLDGTSALRSRERRLRNNIDDITSRFRFEDFEEHRGAGANSTSQPFFRPTSSSSSTVLPPSEDSIVSLMGLGFEREVVIRALQSTGNNIEAAANLLLR